MVENFEGYDADIDTLGFCIQLTIIWQAWTHKSNGEQITYLTKRYTKEFTQFCQ